MVGGVEGGRRLEICKKGRANNDQKIGPFSQRFFVNDEVHSKGRERTCMICG